MSRSSDDTLDKLIETILCYDELRTLHKKYGIVDLNSIKGDLLNDIIHKAKLVKQDRENARKR